jgi:hypothetical protein
LRLVSWADGPIPKGYPPTLRSFKDTIATLAYKMMDRYMSILVMK